MRLLERVAGPAARPFSTAYACAQHRAHGARWQARGKGGEQLMAGAMCSEAGPLEGRRAALLLVRAGAASVVRRLCTVQLLRTSTLLDIRCRSFAGGSLDSRLQLSLGRAQSRRLRVREEFCAQPKPVPVRSMSECTHANRRCVGPAHLAGRAMNGSDAVDSSSTGSSSGMPSHSRTCLEHAPDGSIFAVDLSKLFTDGRKTGTGHWQ